MLLQHRRDRRRRRHRHHTGFVVTATAPIDDETLYIYYVLCTIQVLPEYNQVQYRYQKKKMHSKSCEIGRKVRAIP